MLTNADKYWQILTNFDKYWQILTNTDKYRQIRIEPASASAPTSPSASSQPSPQSPRSDSTCSAHCRQPGRTTPRWFVLGISQCLAYLGWEFITPSLFLEAEKTDVRFWMDQHLGVDDMNGQLKNMKEKAYQVKFQFFDVLEGISTEKTSYVIHHISEIYS